MKNNMKKVTRGKVIIIISLIILFGALGFAALFYAAHLQDNGGNEKIYSAIGISSLLFFGVSIAIGLGNLKTIVDYELFSRLDGLKKCGCATIDSVTKERIKEVCQNNGFTEVDGGYFHKRKISIVVDPMNYYVKIFDTPDIRYIEKDIPREESKFKQKKYKGWHKCLLLFLFTDSVTENQLEKFLYYAGSYYVNEKIVTSRTRSDNTVAILVDESTKKAYFATDGKRGFSTYKLGVKMLNQLFETRKKRRR